MFRTAIRAVLLLLVLSAANLPESLDVDSVLRTFFSQNIGLNQDQIAAIRQGQPVVKSLPARTPAEVFLFGAIHIHAAPESYLRYSHDFNRLRKLPNYLALGVLHNPPRLDDWNGFTFDRDDLEALKSCRPGNCSIQMPESSIDEVHRDITWSAPDAMDQLNQLLHRTAQQFLLAYQLQGNKALGIYNDKRDSVDVSQQFANMFSYDTVLPKYLPDFDRYLLAYPDAKPVDVDDTFYWARVKFGLKPTLRIVQMVTMSGNSTNPVAFAIAEKQLYSSHYFETALDLSFGVRGSEDLKQPGFYLIMSMGSEQAGLTGVKGSVVRKTAVGRSLSGLREALTSVKNTLEGNQ